MQIPSGNGRDFSTCFQLFINRFNRFLTVFSTEFINLFTFNTFNFSTFLVFNILKLFINSVSTIFNAQIIPILRRLKRI